MNVIGEKVSILDSADPSSKGMTGQIVMETAKTILLDRSGRVLRLPKVGMVLQVAGTRRVIAGIDIAGRLEDRIRMSAL